MSTKFNKRFTIVDQLTYANLQELCKEAGLSAKGNRTQLLSTLRQHVTYTPFCGVKQLLENTDHASWWRGIIIGCYKPISITNLVYLCAGATDVGPIPTHNGYGTDTLCVSLYTPENAAAIRSTIRVIDREGQYLASTTDGFMRCSGDHTFAVQLHWLLKRSYGDRY